MTYVSGSHPYLMEWLPSMKEEAFVKMREGYAELKRQVVGTVRMMLQKSLQYWF